MHPVARLCETRGVGMLNAIHVVAFGSGLKRVGAEAVIEMRDHLALIERQATFLTFIKDVAAQLPSITDQLCVGTKKAGITGHIEVSLLERNVPRVLCRFCLSHKDRNTSVYGFG